MKDFRSYLLASLQVVIFILSLLTDWYFPLTLLFLGVLVIMILDKLGTGIVLREMIALHASFICLAMPALGYTFYIKEGASLNFGFWIKKMAVSESVYFGFALPATIAFTTALCWPLNRKHKTDHGAILKQIIERAKLVLENPAMKKISISILSIGVMMFFISGFLPQEVQFLFLLFYFSAFAGLLYVYYLPSFPYRWVILSGFTLFIIFNALRTGMFTIVAYMGITLFSFFFLGSKTSFLKKILLFFVGAFILIIVQNIKPEYRNETWKNKYTGNKTELFLNLFSEQVSKGSFFSAKAYYPVYYRTNQGFNISMVMHRIPQIQPYDNGEKLFLSFSSAFVPRVLWPDKPEAGGKFNMKYYAGVSIKGWSTNVGPLGEAYGSFGVKGGIVFMFILGFCIRWAYGMVFSISRRLPLIILWIPVLFYQITYSAETDTLQIFNSLIKSAFFIWLLYKIVPVWFGVQKEKRGFSRRRELPSYGTQ
ncbi:hypothetical protein HB364_03230 [Pseudoflavitalea sp. X16]|uniref:hypothetical protein n=1 Tax=Paraflavitalea devenefica TaxID=2716334 RepID=UPI001423446F|nr:hypothetical protein [Paraflavitalea devenefica]NII24079.1 hypothetical protein [Paraflavitalea devenefica]